MAERFTDKTETILRQSGWHPSRAVDVSHLVKNLEDSGFQVFPHVKEFFEEFGYLAIVYGPGFYDRFFIHDHCSTVDPHRYSEMQKYGLEAIANQPLCSIGEHLSHPGYWPLFAGENGKIYKHTGWNQFDCIGNNYIEALEHLCIGIPLLHRLYPYDDNDAVKVLHTAKNIVMMNGIPYRPFQMDRQYLQRAGYSVYTLDEHGRGRKNPHSRNRLSQIQDVDILYWYRFLDVAVFSEWIERAKPKTIWTEDGSREQVEELRQRFPSATIISDSISMTHWRVIRKLPHGYGLERYEGHELK
jgi:hypothetical protein